MKMNSICLQLNDLPVEILLIIFRKLHNATLLYSLFDVNKRLNEILCHPILISRLNLLEFVSIDFISPLPYPILHRFCFQILPKIHDKIKWLNLESLSIRRVFLSANYPNLNGLGLYNLEMEEAENFFSDETLFPATLRDQIFSLVIHINQTKNQLQWRELSTSIFVQIVTKFTNLRYLNYAPNWTCSQELFFDISTPSFTSSNLLELYVNIDAFQNCLDLLDGRFNQLRTLHVNIHLALSSREGNNKQEKLPNLRCFVLFTDLISNKYDQLLVSLFQRMSNLEELHLKFSVIGNEEFVDGNNLNNIINSLTQLKKFQFNILSTITSKNQINLITNENIQNTFTNWKFNEVICCVDYFPDEAESQCHIYSYPYRWREYNKITNRFPGGLFNCVREILLFDNHPFEHQFFLRISQSFPFIEIITLTNEKQQKNKQSRKSFDDNQHFSIIHYPHLRQLSLIQAHEDYYEEFLLDTLIVLPNTVRLSVNYQRLKKATHNFQRNATRINCSKIHSLYTDDFDRLSKHFKQYFPRTRIIKC